MTTEQRTYEKIVKFAQKRIDALEDLVEFYNQGLPIPSLKLIKRLEKSRREWECMISSISRKPTRIMRIKNEAI